MRAAQRCRRLPAGWLSVNWRKCGKPNFACPAPDHPGHGPRFTWTRSAGRRKRVGRQLAAAEVEKVRAEVARHAEFTAAVGQIAEVSEKICEARSIADTDAPPVPEGEKGESSTRSRWRSPPRYAAWRRRPPGRSAATWAWRRPRPSSGPGCSSWAVACSGSCWLLTRLPGAPPSLRERPPGRVRGLPGQGHRHCARPAYPRAGLVPRRPVQARPGPQGRRAGRGRAVDVRGWPR